MDKSQVKNAPGKLNEGGFYTTDGLGITISIDKTSNIGGALAHEVTHGIQFENGMISFHKQNDGSWAANTSLINEYLSFDAQASVGSKPSLNWNNRPVHQRVADIKNTPTYQHLPLVSNGLPIAGPQRVLLNANNYKNSDFLFMQENRLIK